MAATFCVRLAWGLIACLMVLTPTHIPPRFFRVQYLTSLGLLGVAAFFLRDVADFWLWTALGSAVFGCFVGSIVWHLDAAPAAGPVMVFTLAALSCVVVLARLVQPPADGWRFADDFAAAALLGAATTSMLMGHSYLIAPAMSLSPLFRLLATLGAVLAVRIAMALAGLWLWTSQRGPGNVESEFYLLLPARWILGLLIPLGLAWMAWETARIRSTQSATGILYVVVIVAFLGELTSQLLLENTGWVL